MKKGYTVREVCLLLGLKQSTIYKGLSKGIFNIKRVEGKDGYCRVLFDMDDTIRYAKGRQLKNLVKNTCIAPSQESPTVRNGHEQRYKSDC